jgi:serine/threonine-protein kinase
LRVEIETILAAPTTAIAAGPAAAPGQPLWKRAWPVALAAIAASILTLAVVRSLPPPVAPAAITRFSLAPVEGQLFSSVGQHVLSISPGGTDIVYVANGTLFLRPLSALGATQIQGVELGRGAASPVFSPDGRYILFWAPDGSIKRIAMVGGAPITVCPAGAIYGMSWSVDGIVFGQSTGIMRVAPDRGTPELIVKTTGDEIVHGPQLLPGGEAVLFTLSAGVAADRWDRGTIVVQSLRDGVRKRLIEGGSDGRYLPTGHLVYALGGTVYGVRFDARRLEIKGNPVPVLEGVQRGFAGASGAAQFSVAENGSLAYIPGPSDASTSQFDIAFTDRKGVIEPLRLPPRPYAFPRLSPSGTHVAFQTDDEKGATVWVHDLRSKSAQRQLTFSGANRYPVWSPDSQRIAFQSDREGDGAIWTQRADGTGAAERLTKPEQGAAHIPDSWSPDGAHLLFEVQMGTQFSQWVLSLRDQKATPLGAIHSTTLTTSVFSPDGRWVAYATARVSGNDTVVTVQPFPPTGARYQVFAKPGDNPHHPLWSADGKELFYVPRVGGFEAVSVATTPTFTFGNAEPVPRAFPTAAPTTPRTFDGAPDGRIISIISAGGVPGRNMQPIHVVLNWFEELNARVK